MTSRLVALLLVLVLALAWVGSTARAPAEAGAWPSAQAAAAGAAEVDRHGADRGALDDPRADASGTPQHAELEADLTGLIVTGVATPGPALAGSRPTRYLDAGRHPPYLDGLQRPPSRLPPLA